MRVACSRTRESSRLSNEHCSLGRTIWAAVPVIIQGFTATPTFLSDIGPTPTILRLQFDCAADPQWRPRGNRRHQLSRRRLPETTSSRAGNLPHAASLGRRRRRSSEASAPPEPRAGDAETRDFESMGRRERDQKRNHAAVSVAVTIPVIRPPDTAEVAYRAVCERDRQLLCYSR
jgi:hypothetical protein